LSTTVGCGSAQACHPQKKKFFVNAHVSVEMPNGNGRKSGIVLWNKTGMRSEFQMGMGMTSLKWEGSGA